MNEFAIAFLATVLGNIASELVLEVIERIGTRRRSPKHRRQGTK